MLQNACKTLGFRKIWSTKFPLGGGEVNHIQPVAYLIKLTHFDETKKKAHDSQIVRAKENQELS